MRSALVHLFLNPIKSRNLILDVFHRRGIDIYCGIQGVDGIEKTADGLRLVCRQREPNGSHPR